jgi:peptide-methionine (S)-S-oxide reductase
MFFTRHKTTLLEPEQVLPGRETPLPVPDRHDVLGTPIKPPFPDGVETAVFGMGCFWGAERVFWQAPGVYTTAVGYAGGQTPNPTYQEACSGRTGHAEVVLVAYDPDRITYEQLLKTFWEYHDPTQSMRQGNDIGTQYRSIILAADDEQLRLAEASRDAYQQQLTASGYGAITTEITRARPSDFYFAEDYHQQYLDQNPRGYCPNHATGVHLPDDFMVTRLQYVD